MRSLGKISFCIFSFVVIVVALFVYSINAPIYKTITIYELTAEESTSPIKRSAITLYTQKINDWFIKNEISNTSIKLNNDELVLKVNFLTYFMNENCFWVLVSNSITDSMFFVFSVPFWSPDHDGFLRNVKSPQDELTEKIDGAFYEFQKTMDFYFDEKKANLPLGLHFSFRPLSNQ